MLNAASDTRWHLGTDHFPVTATVQCKFKTRPLARDGVVTQYSERQTCLDKQKMNAFFRAGMYGENTEVNEAWEQKYQQYVQGLTRKDKTVKKHHLSQETWELIQQQADEEDWHTELEKRWWNWEIRRRVKMDK